MDLKWFESKVGNKYLNEAAGVAAEEARNSKEKRKSKVTSFWCSFFLFLFFFSCFLAIVIKLIFLVFGVLGFQACLFSFFLLHEHLELFWFLALCISLIIISMYLRKMSFLFSLLRNGIFLYQEANKWDWRVGSAVQSW